MSKTASVGAAFLLVLKRVRVVLFALQRYFFISFKGRPLLKITRVFRLDILRAAAVSQRE